MQKQQMGEKVKSWRFILYLPLLLGNAYLIECYSWQLALCKTNCSCKHYLNY